MSSDKALNYDVTANSSGFVSAMERAASAASTSNAQIQKQMETVGAAFAAVQNKVMLLTAAVAGGKMFKDAIDQANKLTSEAVNLSRRLNITAEEAGTLNTALGDIYTDSDTYISAFDQFAKQIKKNEDGLGAMGLKTRDSNGELRDSNTLFSEALAKVSEYKPGLDQTTAAMTLFGRGVDDVIKLQKLNNDVLEQAKEKNEALGLTVTQAGVAASKEYKAAMNDVGDVMTGLANTIGQSVMPMFAQMGNWFASTGPSLVRVFRVALEELMGTFRFLAFGVRAVTEFVSESFTLIAQTAVGIDEVFSKMFSGDFAGMKESYDRLAALNKAGLKRAFQDNYRDALADAKAAFQGDVGRIWGQGPGAGKQGKGGGATMGEFKSGGGPAIAPAHEKSQMGEWEAKLSEAKLAYQEQQNAEGSFRQYSTAQEQAYWRGILALTTAGSKDQLSVRRKLAEGALAIGKEAYAAEIAGLHTQAAEWKNNTDRRLAVLDREAELVRQRFGAESKEYEEVQKRIVEAKRQAVEQLAALDALRLQRARAAQLDEVAAAEEAARLELQLGIISQDEMLAQAAQFEARRYEINAAALRERQAAMQLDPDRNPVAMAQLQLEIEQLEQQHQQRLGQIRNAATLNGTKASATAIDSMQASWSGLLQQMGKGTLSIGNLVRGIFGSVSDAMLKMSSNIVAKWMADQVRMLIFGKVQAVSKITSLAAEAGAGGIASMASAPFPLSLGAPAFGASMAAAALAFAPAASAAGGYDVPAYTNPIVQTHAREMILPERHADVIRALGEGGGGGDGAGGLHINASPMPGGFFAVHESEFLRFYSRLKSNRRI